MKNFVDRFLFMEKLKSPETKDGSWIIINWQKSDDLVFGRLIEAWEHVIQKDEYDVYTLDKWDKIDIKIDDNWRNTVIRWVPKDIAQQVLNGMYQIHKDKIFEESEYRYNNVKPELDKLKTDLGDLNRIFAYLLWAPESTSDINSIYSSLSRTAILELNRFLEAQQNNKYVLDRMEELRKEKSKNQSKELVLPSVLLENDDVINVLQKIWTVNGDKLIIENTEVFKKYSKFIEYMNFIYDTQRDEKESIVDKSWLVDRYLDLINEWTDWIDESIRKMLEFKYIEAIYQDITRDWYSLERDSKTWLYEILVPWERKEDSVREKAPKDYPYWIILERANVRSNLLDVAIVGSIVRKWFDFNWKEYLWEKALIEYILEKQLITNKKWDKILKAELLLLEKDHVRGQIDDKIKSIVDNWNYGSSEDYQQLLFLRNFVVEDQHMRVNHNRTILKNVNEYREFLKSKSLIAWYESKYSKLEDMWEKDFAKMLWDVASENSSALILFGIVAWIMWHQKTALSSLWVALFWWTVAWIVSDTYQWWKKLAWISDKDLELVMPDSINFQLERQEYQKSYQKLAKKNRENANNQWYDVSSWAATKLPVLDNTLLFSIVEDITSRQINEPVKWRVNWKSAIQNLTDKLNDRKLGEAYKVEDVKTFILLLQSALDVDSWDKTTLDYLTEWWRDQLNRPYTWVNFTGESYFDDAINLELRTIYELPVSDSFKKAEIDEIKSYIDSQLYSLYDLLRNIREWKISFTPISTVVTNIDSHIRWIDSALADKLKPILESYQNYSNAQVLLEPYEWLWDWSKFKLEKDLFDFIWMVWFTETTSKYHELVSKITIRIESLDKLKITDSILSTLQIFIDFNSRVDKIKTWLEELVKEIQTKIQEIEGNAQSSARWETIQFDQLEAERLFNSTQLTEVAVVYDEVSWLVTDINREMIPSDLSWLEDYLQAIKPKYEALWKYEATISAIPSPATPVAWVAATSPTASPDVLAKREEIRSLILTFNYWKWKEVQDKIQEILQEYYKEQNENKTKLSGITQTSLLENDIVILRQVEKYLREKGVFLDDTQIRALLALKEANTNRIAIEIFGSDFMNWATTSSLSDVVEAYERSKEQVIIKARAKLDQINQTYLESLDSAWLKAEYKKLEDMKSIDDSLVEGIENKQEEIQTKYEDITYIDSAPDYKRSFEIDYNKIEEDLALLTSRPVQHRIIQSFLNIMAWIDFSSTTITVANNKLVDAYNVNQTDIITAFPGRKDFAQVVTFMPAVFPNVSDRNLN